MMENASDSVLVNLREIFVMEADRQADAAAAVERAKVEDAAREERERRAREDAIRLAREEERRRARAERDARSEAVEARIRALRKELDEVQAARERTQLQITAMATPAEAPASHGHWVAGTMAAMSLVAALTATFVAWPQPTAPIEVASPAPVVVVDAPAETPHVAVADVVVAEATETGDVTETVAAAPEPAAARPRVSPRPRPRPHTPGHDLGAQLDFGDDDGLIPQ